MNDELYNYAVDFYFVAAEEPGVLAVAEGTGLANNGISVTGYLMEHFQSPNRLVSDFNIVNRDAEEPLVLHYGDTLHITFSIYNPLAAPYVFQHEEMGTRISLLYQLADRASYCYYDDDITIEPHSTYLGSLDGQTPL